MVGNAELKPSARLAVLGLLLERPGWGYELVTRFDRTFGEPYDWRITSAAIYQALRYLERTGLIVPHVDEGEGAPEEPGQRGMRQPYRVSGLGARMMREWLAAPMSSSPSQEEVLIRLQFRGADDETLRAMLKRHAEACLAELERIAGVPARTRMERLVKEERRLVVQARLSWVDFARAELRGPDDARIRPIER
ncbi:MAG: PadR family transcriptional regulator [Actinobacteria bacterium]|nr:PadR family transcriptional regulator [Actinomycetota bacterium]